MTVAELGLSSKVFRCIARKFAPGASGDAIVELTLREEFSSTYTDPLVADYGDLTPATPTDVPSDFVGPSDSLSVVVDPERRHSAPSDVLRSSPTPTTRRNCSIGTGPRSSRATARR